MLLAVPSKGRAGTSKTLAFFGPLATAVVPAVEAKDYAANHPGPVLGVPSSVRGITRTRNWILDEAARTGERHVVMADDDLKAQGWIRLGDETAAHETLTPVAWQAEWTKLFSVSAGVGYRIWGVATHSARRGVYPWKPFLWHTYVTGSMMGIVNDGIRFDEKYAVKEDYELCLRCIKEDGGIVGARYLYWETEHWTKTGGCHDYRTVPMERDAVDRLMRAYPGLISRVTRGGSEWSIELNF